MATTNIVVWPCPRRSNSEKNLCRDYFGDLSYRVSPTALRVTHFFFVESWCSFFYYWIFPLLSGPSQLSIIVMVVHQSVVTPTFSGITHQHGYILAMHPNLSRISAAVRHALGGFSHLCWASPVRKSSVTWSQSFPSSNKKRFRGGNRRRDEQKKKSKNTNEYRKKRWKDGAPNIVSIPFNTWYFFRRLSVVKNGWKEEASFYSQPVWIQVMQCAHLVDSDNKFTFFSRKFIGLFVISFRPFHFYIFLLFLGGWLFFWESFRKKAEREREDCAAPSWCWVMTAHSFVLSSSGLAGHQLFSFLYFPLCLSPVYSLTLLSIFACYSRSCIYKNILRCQWIYVSRENPFQHQHEAPLIRPRLSSHFPKHQKNIRETRLFLLWVSTSLKNIFLLSNFWKNIWNTLSTQRFTCPFSIYYTVNRLSSLPDLFISDMCAI